MNNFGVNRKNKGNIFSETHTSPGTKSSERFIVGFQESEKQLIKKFTADAENLINHNEWGVGLENLLSNLYEIDFPLDRKAVDLAKDAIKACKMDYNEWAFIEELMK